MADEIRIKGLALRCIVGVYPEERREKQDVVINVALSADLDAASRSDMLSDTVDYKAIKKRIVAMVEDSSFQLIEKLAGRVAEICLEAPGVKAVEVEVEKPGALRFARTVSVVVRRP
ncbi:MAG: dihydroneopterin aldolase [Elusimicrobia bacterium]|nr:dihydroneopterin aldolase [Elusimicrobiota bacterium]